MEIKYQVSYDDFLDAMTAHQQRAMKRRKGLRRLTRTLLITELVLLVVIGGMLWLLFAQLGVPIYALKGLVYSTASAMPITVPWLVLYAVLALLGVAQRKPRRAGFFMIMASIIVVASGIAAFSVGTIFRSTYTFGSQIIAPPVFTLPNLFGWITLVLLCLMLVPIASRQPMKTWIAQPNVARPKTVRFRPDGLLIQDEFSQRDIVWAGIEQVVDTPSLILLYSNKLSFEIIPKRAFPDEQTFDQFWRFVGSKGEANPKGFDVKPVIPLTDRFERP
jgi:hypothetical protein